MFRDFTFRYQILERKCQSIKTHRHNIETLFSKVKCTSIKTSLSSIKTTSPDMLFKRVSNYVSTPGKRSIETRLSLGIVKEEQVSRWALKYRDINWFWK
ncbi:Uncharacterized protein TCM_040054 [Theobroma cacao]|uniref:Uncharacterized protein n=1 Tax=Theobroma cacao TaxID=3641 RepID=A0A061GSD1_THECC|nr:Uncharacterized protein TCM_040054 [Theobroma cacao]